MTSSISVWEDDGLT